MLSIACLIGSILLLIKAITFHSWSHNTLNDTIKSLKIKNKKIKPNEVKQ